MINSGKLRQFHAAFASGFGSLLLGIITVWPSYVSELYSSNSSTPLSAPMTKMEDSLLGSVPALGAMLGTAAAGTIIDKFGRRNGGILITIPFLISWIIIGVSSSIKVILGVRFLAGVASGASVILSPVMVSEVSEDSIRGALASVALYLFGMGTLLSYLMGWFLSYRIVIWINVGLSVIAIVLIMLVEESPIYLIKKGRDQDAKLAIAHYRGIPTSSMTVWDEFYKLKQQLTPVTKLLLIKTIKNPTTKGEEAEQVIQQEIQPESNPIFSSLKSLFLSPSSRRAFLVVATTITLQMFMGMTPVQVYANVVFTETDPSRSNLYTVVFAAVQFIGALVTAVAADKTGRRFLQISSSGIVCVCLIVLGYLLQFKTASSWVTMALIMMYSFFFLVGVGSVPYLLMAEVFVPEVLNLASMLIIEWVWFVNFFIIAVFPYITDYVGIHGAFYGFAVVSFANAIISYIILPETAGLSNEQIQQAFLCRRNK